GEQVSLTVTRPTTGEPLSFDIIRAEIDAPSVTYTMLPNDVALIRISVFSTGVTNQLKSAIRAVKRAGATSLILDLRDNGGGIVFEAIGVASQFVPEGKALYLYQERDGETKTIKAVPNGLATDIPMIVLINNNSASSSEITAASIQDAGRGKLVGESTFGTGTVLTPFQLDDGSEVILGTALWLTPDGQSAWHVGLPPDIEVAMPADADQIYPNSDTNEISMATLKESTDVQLKTAFNTVTGTETFPVEK
ncbi:MAG TPA: S41 family peptidase, partial [Thermomicrobiales bacterium]|nr:S41 family peptidase [Thermomicrobiales bacterium]